MPVLSILVLVTPLAAAVGLASPARGGAPSTDVVFHPVERIWAEIDFAERLAAAEPAKAASWQPLIEKARARVQQVADRADQRRLRDAIVRAEAQIARLQLPVRGGKRIPEQDRPPAPGIEGFHRQLTALGQSIEPWASREALRPPAQLVYRAISDGQELQLARAVAEAERIMAPIGAEAKTFTLSCLGHAHIDMNWLWSWEETVAVTNDTFTTVLELMDEFPEFTFAQSQIAVYDIVRRYNPELFERIRKRIAEGRWEVVASQWVEGDKNLPSGESLARHLLYSRRFASETLGLRPEDVAIDWEPDTFGHAATLPSILARGGVSRMYLCRGGRFEKPAVFWWKAPDGSRVLVNFEKEAWYNGTLDTHNAVALLQLYAETGLKDRLHVYGVGDHGGGPTRLDLRRAREMGSWPVYPAYRMTTTREYYRQLEAASARLPVVDRELNFEFEGCYTSQSQTKLFTRLAENLLEASEAAAALAERAVGRSYPGDRLREAWTRLLFWHFHDILPGSNVHLSREYQSGLAQQTFADAGLVRTNALRAVAAAIDTSFAGAVGGSTGANGSRGDSRPAADEAMGAGAGHRSALGGLSEAGFVRGTPVFVVFNPSAWPRQEVVTGTLWDPADGQTDVKDGAFEAAGADGRVVAAQKVEAGEYWGHRFVKVSFPAAVPPLGYAAFGLKPNPSPRSASAEASGKALAAEPIRLENDFLRAVVDPATGGLSELTEKASGRNLCLAGKPMAALEMVIERGADAWSLGTILERVPPKLVALERKLAGPHVQSALARVLLGESTVELTYALDSGSPQLTLTVETLWLERGSQARGTPTLRIQFPLALDRAKARYEIPYGWIERDLNGGEETPGQRWADVVGRSLADGSEAGFTLLNDSKYGHSLDGATLRLTLLRSSFNPDPLPELGPHTVRLALRPHAGRPAPADLMRAGVDFNRPLQVVSARAHPGRLPAVSRGVLSVEPSNIVLTAFKKSEDGQGYVVRVLETEGRATTARVRLDPALLGALAAASETDLLERPIAPSSARVEEGQAALVEVPARGITSLKLEFAVLAAGP